MSRWGLPLVACLACSGLCLTAGGCLMMADSNTTAEGASAAVDPATLAKIETGKTTRQWVIAALGEPTSM